MSMPLVRCRAWTRVALAYGPRRGKADLLKIRDACIQIPNETRQSRGTSSKGHSSCLQPPTSISNLPQRGRRHCLGLSGCKGGSEYMAPPGLGLVFRAVAESSQAGCISSRVEGRELDERPLYVPCCTASLTAMAGQKMSVGQILLVTIQVFSLVRTMHHGLLPYSSSCRKKGGSCNAESSTTELKFMHLLPIMNAARWTI